MRHEGESGAAVFWRSLCGFSPGVAVMEAAQPAMRDDSGSATRSRLHRARVRSVLLQREMAAVARIISDVVTKEAPEMALVQNHHAIQQLPAAASDPALGDAVLPGTPRCDPLRLDAHRLNR